MCKPGGSSHLGVGRKGPPHGAHGLQGWSFWIPWDSIELPGPPLDMTTGSRRVPGTLSGRSENRSERK